MSLEAGQSFGGYTIEAVLGRGGMGTVYLATHERLARKVALKVIAAELADDEEFRARFLRESQLAASLDHPNIIAIYDAGEVDRVLYLAMRYVSGPSLHALIRERGALTPAEVLRITEQIGGALDAAHAAGLVHRDVKPANVLLAEPGYRAYLSDFGLAKRTSSAGITRAGAFLGTVDYCAPEQIQGGAVDGSADVYSLGAVVFHCLAGEPPYVRETEIAVAQAHLADPPPALSTVRTDLRVLDGVLATAMAKHPEVRYATAGALAGALRGALASRGIAADADATRAAPAAEPPTETHVATPVRAKSRRGMWWLAAAVAVAAISGAVAGVLVTRDSAGGSQPKLERFVDRVEGVLERSSRGRQQIGGALAAGLACRITPQEAAGRMQQVVENRRTVLDQLVGLPAPTPEAARTVALLRQAMNQSIEADIHYRDGFRAANGCPLPKSQDFSDAKAADGRASAAKQRFVTAFNALALRFARRTWSSTEL